MRQLKTGIAQIGLLTLLVLIWTLLTLLLHSHFATTGVILSAGAAVLAILFLQLEVFSRVRDIRREQENFDRQIQDVLNLHTVLKPASPFPVMRLAALSPDTGVEYLNLIRTRHPRTIVELGSGVSTLIAALLLRDQGEGKVFALDHDQNWLEQTRNLLSRHGVEERVELRHAPLTLIPESSHRWYDPQALAGIEQIDLLLVDGPPDYSDKNVRLPGLTRLKPLLSPDAVIVVDDCCRPRWKKSVKGWAAANGFTVIDPFKNESGTLFLYSTSVVDR